MTNETSTRFLVAPALGANDQEEKDYEWGDVNNNGWVDLVIMRKQPFSTPGKRVNVLMMNEGGVLVDRTSQYASSTDVPGDQGFLTPTNDRHSILYDLLNNGWLDLTTAPAYGSGSDPKSLGHPRIYRNLGAASGSWEGFHYEVNRIPTWSNHPNTCYVAAGDVTGNGFADLYFVTYSQSAPDMLIINNGIGFFTDQTLQFLPSAFANSSFGTSGFIADLNGNGWNDIIKAENGPVKAVYNLGNGNFTNNTTPSSAAHYHMNVADLNNNGRLDIIIVDDGQDRVRLNLSTNANGTVNWSNNIMLPEKSTASGGTGFGGNVYAVDFNNNGWNDIIVADTDVDLSGCNRFSNIYRNNGNPSNLAFSHDLANIPSNMLQGVFDFGLLDITGNGWIDIVSGRCSGTQVWISNPPFEVVFDYPFGRPAVVEPNTPETVTVLITPHGGSIEPGSAKMHVAVNGSAVQEVVLDVVGENLYQGVLPGVDCQDEIAYSFSARIGAVDFVDPPGAGSGQGNAYIALAADGTEPVLVHDFDEDDGGFVVTSHSSLTQGAWQHGVPQGSLFFGQVAAPFGDASESGNGQAWATCLGGPAATCNVAHGPTHLISEVFDLSFGPAKIVYDRWFFCSNANDPGRKDWLRTYVSNDGGNTWVFVHEIDTTAPSGGSTPEWQTASFVVNEFVTPTANVVVRFTVEDEDNNSITNAGIDNVRLEAFTCGDTTPACPGDLTNSGSVGVPDLLELLGAWGPCASPCPADLTNSGSVGVPDLLELLGAWGPCPE